MSSQINPTGVLHLGDLPTADSKDVGLKPLLVHGGYNPAWTLRQVKQSIGCLPFPSLVLSDSDGPQNLALYQFHFAFPAPLCIYRSPSLLIGGLNAIYVQLLSKKVTTVKFYSSVMSFLHGFKRKQRRHYSHCYH